MSQYEPIYKTDIPLPEDEPALKVEYLDDEPKYQDKPYEAIHYHRGFELKAWQFILIYTFFLVSNCFIAYTSTHVIVERLKIPTASRTRKDKEQKNSAVASLVLSATAIVFTLYAMFSRMGFPPSNHPFAS